MEQKEWKKPTTWLEELQGASACIEGTVSRLPASLQSLQNTLQDYDRLQSVSWSQMNYELLSESDIRYAAQQVVAKRLPEIDSLLTRAQAGLAAYEKEVDALKYKVEEQNEIIKALEQGEKGILNPPEQRPPKQRRIIKNHIKEMEEKKKAREHELASLQQQIDQKELSIAKIKAEKAARQQEQKQAMEKDQASLKKTVDQTMTAEDLQTVNRIKKLCNVLLPKEDIKMVVELLDEHAKTDN